MFNKISKELNVQGNICEVIEKYFEYTNKHKKIRENEKDLQFDGYRDINQEKRNIYINNKLSKLTIHEKLQKPNLNDVMVDFDATSVYLSAIWDENSVYLKLETRFAFKPVMNKTYVDAFNNWTFNDDGNESVLLKIKYYNPPDLIVRHLPVKEKVKIIEVSRMRNGYITDTLTSVDICETVKTRAKVIEIYEGVLFRENFQLSPFRKVVENLFAFRQKQKDENNDLI